jgi:uncharacterized membrane protein YfcA
VQLALLIAAGAAAGVFGALLGLGGGILIVPLLTLGFGLPFREAVGASLVCVIVTSSAAASVYLQREVANLRLGMTLELFTAAAALIGGLVAFALPERLLGFLFALLLLYVAVGMARRREAVDAANAAEPSSAERAAAAPTRSPTAAAVPSAAGPAASSGRAGFLASLSGPGYRVHHLGIGAAGSLLAGLVSGLFGIGGGIVKVPVMNMAMGVPMRVATATSNMMIGVTASAGAIVYLVRGGIDPYVAAPTAVGVFVGASITSRLAHRANVGLLRGLFVVVLTLTAAQILLRVLP